MGGGGSIQGMLDSLRHNRGQLKKHRKSFRELAENYPARGGARGIDLKKATPEELKAIRSLILERRRRVKRRNRMLLIMLIVLIMSVLSLLFI